jgi:hypothetical protein
MKPKKTVINYQELYVDLEQQPGADLLEHLKSNVLGTPGGLRYRHTQTEDKLRNLVETHFLLLWKSVRMFGSLGLYYRQTVFF